MPKKRQREKPAVDIQLVEIYEDLAHVDEKIRLKAAHTLLTKVDREGVITGSRLNEVLRRLFRGLCSGRKAARLGFSVALTELLTAILGPKANRLTETQGIPELIDILEEQTNISGNVSGQEERDHQFGRLFGAESIIRSKILLQDEVDLGLWERVLSIIYELAKRKPLLREECGFILADAIRAVRDQSPKYAQSIIDGLNQNGLTKTSEGVAMWIVARDHFQNLQFPSDAWQHHSNPLDRREKATLAKILKDGAAAKKSTDDDEKKSIQQGSWSTKIHFVWDVILTKLLRPDLTSTARKAKEAKGMNLADFWETCVDKTFFATTSSEERKFSGFLLFQRIIRDAPITFIISLFTQNFTRCLINQLGSTDRFLHRAAENTVKSILGRAASDSQASVSILKALVKGPHGDVNFDKITKTKTIETLLSQAQHSDFHEVSSFYKELILQPGIQDEKGAASRRLIAVDQLVSALRSLQVEPNSSGSTPNQGHMIHSILSLLVKCGYFDLETLTDGQSDRPNPPISQSSRQAFRSRLSSCLAHLIAKSRNPAEFTYELLAMIHDSGKPPEMGQLLLETDESVTKVIAKAWEILAKAYAKAKGKESNSAKGNYLRSVVLLYSLTMLQVYNEDAEAVIILEELNGCFEGLIHKKGPGKDSAALVEILLGFVSKPSQLFRRLAQQVFTVCAEDIDEVGMKSMITVLETGESLSGQAEMFDQEDDEDEESTSGISDVESVDMAETRSSSSASREADNGNDQADESDGPDEELAAFDTKLAQALGTRPGHEDLDAQDSSSSDEDMDDEQMESLDQHLEKIFREKKKLKSKKTEKKDAKETIINFKCRVLELLEIYVKQQHAKTLALDVLFPILTTIRTTTSPLVSSKAYNLMREFSKLCKGEGMPQIQDVEAVFGLIEEVHVEAGKEGSNAHASACSQASLLLVRVLVAQDRELLRRVIKIYGNTQEKALFDSSYHVKTPFFTEWLNWCTSARK